jgi:hypothetical protein
MPAGLSVSHAEHNATPPLSVLMRKAYQESLAIRRKLAVIDLDNVVWQRDVAVSLEKEGRVRLLAGARWEALAAYEEGLAIRRNLARISLRHPSAQADLVSGLYWVSTAADVARARAVLQEALPIAEELARENRLASAQRAWPQALRDALEKLPAEAADAQ